MTNAEMDAALATPRTDPLSDAISTIQFMRTQLIDIAIKTKQCETNLDVALRLLQELVARR